MPLTAQNTQGDSTNRLMREEVGSGLVEYALIFILFMTMLMGIADFGRLLYSDHYISNAARDATRWASVNGADCNADASCTAPAGAGDVQNFVTNNAPLGIDSTQLTITPTWPSTGGACGTVNPKLPGCLVEVKVQYKFKFAFPFVSNQTLTLTSVSQTVILH